MYKKQTLPSVGDYVIITIEKLENTGARCKLEEYENVIGIIPTDELPLRRVSSLVGKRTAALVIDVDENSRIVTLSIKRINQNKVKIKMLEYKKEELAYNIIKLISKNENIPLEELDKAIVQKIIKSKKLYDAFIEIYTEGEKIITQNYRIKKDLANLLYKYIRTYFKPPTYTIKIKFYAYTVDSEGINIIKKFLSEIKSYGFEIKYLGGGQYLINYETINSKDVQEKSKMIDELLKEKSKEYGIVIELIKEEE